MVASFTFRCERLAAVQAGSLLYDLDDAGEVLRWYRQFAPAQPDALWGALSLRVVPPLAQFPEELRLRKVCSIGWCLTGQDESPALREARAFGKPLVDGVKTLSLPEWKRQLSSFDALYPAGEQQYWRGEFVNRVPDEAVERHLEHAASMPGWKSAMTLYPVDGAAARVANDATAWAHRHAVWAMVFAGTDPDPANAAAITDWVDRYAEALQPYTLGGGYVKLQHGTTTRARARDVRRQLRAARADQSRVRPAKLLPRQSQHRARGLSFCDVLPQAREHLATEDPRHCFSRRNGVPYVGLPAPQTRRQSRLITNWGPHVNFHRQRRVAS